MSLSEQSDASLVERWQRQGDDGAREALVHRYRGLVRALAARYVNWGEPFDDLVQVAWIGLLKAIERYDSERGVQFPTYATPTIVGEIRRYYRDRAWAVHVPRSVQELRVRVNATIDQWSAEHGEAPTTAELATYLDVSPDAILDAIHSENARSALALPSGEDDRAASGFDVPTEERGFDQVDANLLLAGGLDELPERERQIVAMRFEEGLTQSQIAARIGISQMHVSRLLRRALAQLRASVGEDDDAGVARAELALDAQGERSDSPSGTTSTCFRHAGEEIAASGQPAGAPDAGRASGRERAEADHETALRQRRDDVEMTVEDVGGGRRADGVAHQREIVEAIDREVGARCERTQQPVEHARQERAAHDRGAVVGGAHGSVGWSRRAKVMLTSVPPPSASDDRERARERRDQRQARARAPRPAARASCRDRGRVRATAARRSRRARRARSCRLRGPRRRAARRSCRPPSRRA